MHTLTYLFLLGKDVRSLNAGKRIVPYVIIILLLIALGFTSSAAFAYWQEISVTGNVVIRFDGEDANLKVDQLSSEFTGKLVPEGQVFFEGEVEFVTFQYQVSLDKTLVKSVNLIVESVNVKIGESTEYAHLVDITINGEKDVHTNELFNSVVTITVTIRLLEPLDLSEVSDPSLANVEDSRVAFNAIKGQTISFSLNFRVEQKNEVID